MTTGYEPLNNLKPIADNIWIVDGSHINFYVMPFSTRMTVIRLKNNDLFIHSPIALTDSLAAEIETLGTVRHLISPNWIHYASIATWQKSFDNTVAWASPNVEARARKYHVDIKFDRTLGEHAETEWTNEISQLIAHGSSMHIEVVFFHKASKTLVLTDLIENFEAKNLGWILTKLTKLAGNQDPDGKAPIDMRLSFFKGKTVLRDAVNEMISWAPEKIILAHGRCYLANGVEELRRGFRWVLA